MKSLILLFVLFFAAACTTHPHSEGRDQYIAQIDRNSAGDKQFAGLYDNFEFRSTLLTREMVQAIHERTKKYYAWDEQEAAKDLNARMSTIEDSARIWLSFYTPDRKNDNLANKVSIWKIYLETNGKRYEGRASKANLNFAEAQAMFYYHSRWATAYYVDFPIPTDQMGPDPKLIITGPLGRREVTYKDGYDNDLSSSEL